MKKNIEKSGPIPIVDPTSLPSAIAQVVADALKEIYPGVDVSATDIIVETPEHAAHGEYTTNVALMLAKSLEAAPREIATGLAKQLDLQIEKNKARNGDQTSVQIDQKGATRWSVKDVLQAIDRVEVAGPGFINLFLSESVLSSVAGRVLKLGKAYGSTDVKDGTKLMIEYAHPNTHKAFHIGHLRNITSGESLVRILGAVGYEVIPVNYQGDVGMHIAKALYALMHIAPYKDDVKTVTGVKDRVEFLGRAYAAGSTAFKDDENAQATTRDINFLIYAAAQKFQEKRGVKPGSTDYMSFVEGQDADVEKVSKLWEETRQWSLDYFDMIYARVGTKYERFYFESECTEGVDICKMLLKKGVLTESKGAIVFDGEPHGIHTRVFVNSMGLPTYEGKEMALAPKEFSEYGELERNIHVVGPEQSSFFEVTFKAQELWDPKTYGGKQYHQIGGWVRLKEGKMSSRSGNVIYGESLIDEAKEKIKKVLSASKMDYTDKEKESIAEKAAVAAVKYSFLRVSIDSTLSFDMEESISFDGNSGPYLQYTYARCASILRKAKEAKIAGITDAGMDEKTTDSLLSNQIKLNSEERALTRSLLQFPEVVTTAASGYAPSAICTYLFNLAQQYNTFYAQHSVLSLAKDVSGVKNQVSGTKKKSKNAKQVDSTVKLGGVDDATRDFRIGLTASVAQTVAHGLHLLGIETIERM